MNPKSLNPANRNATKHSMKCHLLLITTLLALALADVSQAVVPTLISYQGHVSNGTGTEIGASPTPVNRTVTFRFWNHATAAANANRLYAESAVVTINNGDFSVLIGQGTPTAESTVHANLANAGELFNGSDVYLGITVDDGNAGTTDVEISPRQRIVSSAFAFRAKVAESVDSGAISNAMLANNAVNSVQVVNGAIGTSKIAAQAVTGALIANGTIISGNLQDNAVTTDKITADAVTGAKILDGTIGSADLAANSVGSLQLQTASVYSDDIADSNVATVDLADNAVTSIKIATGAVANSDLADGAVNSAKISDGAVNSAKISDGSIATADIANSAVTAAKLGSDVGNWPVSGSNVYRSSGNVGIGTATPTEAKLVVRGGPNANPVSGTYRRRSTGGYLDNTTVIDVGIFADKSIWTDAWLASSSDKRIKNVEGNSDGVEDLNKLLAIEITDYTYIDTPSKGTGRHKKVIAQQVEKVFPQAVSQHTSVVPDIYKNAAVAEGWVSLKTDLKKGERVRLIGDKSEGIHEVLEVAEGRFRTAFKPEDDKVFVYGREVNDFRTVDYDAIAMLNVSATQELARKLAAKDAEVKALQLENAQLSTRLAALENRDKARDEKLVLIEKLLFPTAGATPVNLDRLHASPEKTPIKHTISVEVGPGNSPIKGDGAE